MCGYKYVLLLILFFRFTTSDEGSIEPYTRINLGVLSSLRMSALTEACMSMSLLDFYSLNSDYQTRLALKHRNCEDDLFGMVYSVLDLVKNEEVDAIILPQKLPIDAKLAMELEEKIRVPIIQFAEPRSSQAKATTDLIKVFGWHDIVFIDENTELCSGFLPQVEEALGGESIHIAYRTTLPPSANELQILEELNKMTLLQTRIFLVHLSTKSLAFRLFELANEVGLMGEGYAWIITNELSSSLDSEERIPNSMEGVLGLRHCIPQSKTLNSFKERLKKGFALKGHVTLAIESVNYCLFVYDIISALGMAVETKGKRTSTLFLKKVEDIKNHDIDHEIVGVPNFGSKFINEISAAKHKGLTGEFRMVNGTLQSSAFEIFNVIGTGKRVIGYWTPNKGISKSIISLHEGNENLTPDEKLPRRKLSSTTVGEHSSGGRELKKIIWPGDSTVTPESSVQVRDKKTLKIGIPNKQGFLEFVRIIEHSNKTNATGFSVDVFYAAVNLLPPELQFNTEFEAFNGTYDDLVREVNKTYAAAVGDITILSNRSNYCDFTLPYTETVVGMLVPVKYGSSGDIWVFIKPLKWDLWLTIFATCIFVGIAVKVLEQRVTTTIEPCGEHPMQRFSNKFFIPFLWLVCPERKMVANVCSMIVLFMWIVLTYILMQSYTASLTARLTVEQLQPLYLTVDELKKGDYIVGYQSDSFVGKMLLDMKFKEKNIRNYDSVEGYYKAFRNDNVSAIFDEMPYLKVFLKKHKSGFMVVGPINRTTGLGFAFPRDSNLTYWLSRAILNLTDHGAIDKLEKKYLGDAVTKLQVQQDSSPTDNSPSLGAASFGGLFVVTGATTVVALLISQPYVWQKLELAKQWFPAPEIPNDTITSERQQTQDSNSNGLEGDENERSSESTSGQENQSLDQAP